MASKLGSVAFTALAVLPCASLTRPLSELVLRETAVQQYPKWLSYSPTEVFQYPLNFTSSQVSHQNLGGAGPDAGDESIIIKRVGNVGGYWFDLRMSASHRKSWAGATNKTLLYADSGIIQFNLESGTSTKVNVHFVDSTNGAPTYVPRVFMTILDIDAGSLEGFGANPNAAGGVESYSILPSSEVWFSKTHEFDVRREGSEYNFTAASVGGAADNPTDAMSMTPLQKDRSVMLELRRQKVFQFTFAATPGTSSRNVMFSGPSSLAFDGMLGACEMPNKLDLTGATMEMNSLDQPDGQMMIRNAMLLGGEPIDLIVKVAEGTYEAEDGSKNALHGGFAYINLKQGVSVGLLFEFRNQDGQPVSVPNLFFTFADIDQEGNEEAFEAVAITSNTGTYFLSENTTVSAHTGDDGYITFVSSMRGFKDNNPMSAELVGEEKDNAVTLHFLEPVQNFTAYLSAETKWLYGRNIVFGGDISVACD